MNRSVLLPGSYDPVTLGHIDIVNRALAHFDQVHVVIFINPDKQTLFSLEERLSLLQIAFKKHSNILIDASDGLVADYAAKHNISFLVKGVRNEADFSYELAMSDHHFDNYRLDTFLLPCDPAYRHISSSAVKNALFNDGTAADMLPSEVESEMRRFLSRKKIQSHRIS